MDYKVQVIDAETGEVSFREMTDKEIAERKKDAEDWDNFKAAKSEEEKAIAAKRAELLDKLGITEDEAKLLLS